MIPLVICSVVGSAIIVERMFSLRRSKIIPNNLLPKIWKWLEEDSIDEQKIEQVMKSSSLGRVLSVGLINRRQPRFIVQQRLEDIGRQIYNDLEQFLYILEVIVAIAPFLGLLGTVLGMIEIFNAIGEVERADSKELASGISTALITTVTGLIIAIPALAFHRYFLHRISGYIVEMEKQADRLLDVIQFANK